MDCVFNHDQLHSSIHFRICRILPDGRLGIGQAQELQIRVQKLPEIAKGHCSIHPVKNEYKQEMFAHIIADGCCYINANSICSLIRVTKTISNGLYTCNLSTY